jgi:hypothetical protein
MSKSSDRNATFSRHNSNPWASHGIPGPLGERDGGTLDQGHAYCTFVGWMLNTAVIAIADKVSGLP